MTRTLFITGASSGIGAATARAAANADWNVALFARSADKLNALAEDIGPGALAVPGDVTDRAQVEEAIATTVAHFGTIDAVFANAGKGLSAAGTENGDPDEWHDMIHLNIMGLLYTVKAALPHLKRKRQLSSTSISA
jgi:NADP-dependent 3-hydroxy acid dehydrogenase YdfG